MVKWSDAEVKRLKKSESEDDKALAGVMGASLASGWNSGQYQVYFLSGVSDEGTLTRSDAILHTKKGRGSAFVQSYRYHSLNSLMGADNTSQL